MLKDYEDMAALGRDYGDAQAHHTAQHALKILFVSYAKNSKVGRKPLDQVLQDPWHQEAHASDFGFALAGPASAGEGCFGRGGLLILLLRVQVLQKRWPFAAT